MDGGLFSFGRFRLDLGRRRLLRDQQPVRLGSRALEILCVLASAEGRIVSKDDLMALVWPGTVVEENNLHVHISALRKALDEESSGQSYLVTIPGRGYRLVGPQNAPLAEFATKASLSLPDKPSIAVLPFSNISDDPEQEYFADGIVEEIITALSRIRWLFVIAHNSSFSYKSRSVEIKQVGHELGVRYVLEGSLRKSGHRLRISARLIEAATGSHLWADHFDGSLEDIFDVQDKVASGVAGIIEPALEAAEICRSCQLPTRDLTAYDLYLRALPHRISWERDRTMYALGLLQEAIQRDPDYGPAFAISAWCHLVIDNNDWAEDAEANRGEGIALARRALQMDSNDPRVIGNAAFVLGYFGENIDAAIRLVEHSLALSPSFAWGWLLSGFLHLYAGQTDRAVEHIETSLRLNPRDRRAFHFTGIGIAHFVNRQFASAAQYLAISLEELPSFTLTYRFLASCYAHMGRLAEARDIVDRLRAITPVVLRGFARYRNLEHRELLLSGLRMVAEETVAQRIGGPRSP